MNAADDDAQSNLEQRALRNVHSLARRLGYADAIDRYGERFVLKWLAVAVFFVVSAAAIVLAIPDEDPHLVLSRRCRVEMAIQAVDKLRADLKEHQPGLTKAELERRVTVNHTDVKREAEMRCRLQGL